jgi:hypothetical protein
MTTSSDSAADTTQGNGPRITDWDVATEAGAWHDGQPQPITTLRLGGRTITIHESMLHAGVLNIEIDGDLDAHPVRLHLNDNLVLDTAAAVTPIDDPRRP